MPNAPAPRPERHFCSNCGFPARASGQSGERARALLDCEACGAPPAPFRADDTPAGERPLQAYSSPAEGDVAGLERAMDAFLAKDLPRCVEHLLTSEAGVPPRAVATPDGPGWVVAVRGALIFVTLRTGDVLFEAPISRLPARQRLPALRLALELCGRDAASSRVSARGELLLLRFSARLALLTPPVLRYHLREIAHLASRYASLMTVGLDALPAFADGSQGTVAFDAMGRPRKIHVGGDGGPRRSAPPLDVEAVRAQRPRSSTRPLPRDEPDSRSPRALAEAAAAADAGSPAPAPGPKPTTGESLPAVLSSRPVQGAAASGPVPRPGASSEPRPAEAGRRPSSSSNEPISDSRAKLVQGGAASTSRSPSSSEPVSRPEIELDTVSRRSTGSSSTFEAVRLTPTEPLLSPSDRMCMLLRHAQSLASLALEERPATMAWLVRSAVFRAIYDFKDLLPDSVAHLYRCTGTGQGATGARSSTPVQAVEPALVVMERLIVARAQVPKEKPLAIEPMTSAVQAKEHVARYLGEIDRAPGDPPLRHFLALGALTELLVRTKLPPQTDQRLRDIVSHAQREGAKPSAIDLMMTALQRINS